jgi:hypothetical protein
MMDLKDNSEKAQDEKPVRTRSKPGSMTDFYMKWDKLATNLRPYLTDMPHTAEDHAELEAVLAKIRTSFAEQEVHTRRIAQLVAGRKAEMQAAQDLRSRLAANLQGRFGPTSERLLEFGIKPRRRRNRTRPKEGEPLPEPPTTIS